jgi:hypothetical protein
MVMKKSSLLLILAALLILPVTLHAVAYPFTEKKSYYLNEELVIPVGAKLYLFHSGTDEIRKTIHENDTLTVYREYPPDFSVEPREVGKVKVLSPLGDYYLNGEVIGGEVKAGDLAKKGTVACFIISTGKNGHQ